LLKLSINQQFHFVIDTDLYEKLNSYSIKYGMRISDIIDFILHKSMFLLEQVDFTLKRVKPSDFKEDELVMLHNLKIRLNINFKRKLFQLQDHFQIRSKASILRYIIRKYYNKFEKWYLGEKKIRKDVLKRCRKIWDDKKRKQTLNNDGIWEKAHLGHMSQKNHRSTTYIYDQSNILCQIIQKYSPPDY